MADSEDPRPSGGVSPLAVTIDADTEHLTATQRSGDSLSSVQGVPVAVIEGSTPELSHETNVLLRARLRAAALFLSVGYGVFLVAHLFRADFTAPIGVFLLVLHVGTVLVLALVGGMMCRHCDIPLRWLRASELVIFGMPVLFFMVLGYYLIEGHLPLGYFDFQPGPWLVLMFVYAMFIPNTWRRAAVVIGVIAVTPLVLVIAIVLTDPRVADVTMIETWTRLPLMLGLTWAGSVFGVYTIGTLRREAFEARQLGQYRLKRRIGAGGMGEVYLAEHQLMKRPCVIKLIRPDKAGDPRTLARFQREVRATAKLSHWNTVEIFDYGSTDRGHVLLRDGVPARHEPGRAGRAFRADAAGAGGPSSAAGVRCAGRSPRGRADPSRHQAGQHLRGPAWRRLRRGQAARLRPGQAARTTSSPCN